MAYIATTRKQTFHVDPQKNAEQPGRITVQLEEKSLVVDWRQIATLAASQGKEEQGGRYTLLIENTSYEIFARNVSKKDEKGSQTYEIFVAGERFEVVVEDERARLLSGLVQSSASSGEAKVVAPMPGLVTTIPVEVGANVEEGQTVVVLEAMKMENDLAAPISGTVKEIRVNKGQTVENGEVLMIIEGADL